jgi:hypothetical protein
VPNNTKFSDEFYERWEHLISTVEISEVPMRFIKEVCVKLDTGETHSFDINLMLQRGYDTEQLEEIVQDYLDAHDDLIDVVDFHINLSALADEVEPRTHKLLD